NLSDLAAMGAEPRACTLGIALPEVDEAWLQAFAAGLHALAERHRCPLIGGDTTRGPLNVCVTVLGVVPRGQALRRDAARVGDDIWVSGTLGAAAWAVSARARGQALAPSHPARQRLDWPQPRLALGRALCGRAACAIDISDGLSGDLGHVLERSGCGAALEWARIPVDPALQGCDERDRHALVLGGGDDYELLFTAPAPSRGEIAALGERVGTPVSRIGSITAQPGISLLRPDGSVERIAARGFDHFGAATSASARPGPCA
ncbi:MAG: thiamine-phosphate kinase, partial [Burkholderiales bacterium]